MIIIITINILKIYIYCPSICFVSLLKIKESCEHLKNLSTAPPAIKLFAQWCEKAPKDPAWRGRFKVSKKSDYVDCDK